MKRIAVELDDDFHKRVKMQAVIMDMSIKEYLSQLLEKDLETKKPANKSQVLFSRFLKLFVNLFLCTIRRPALYPAYTKS